MLVVRGIQGGCAMGLFTRGPGLLLTAVAFSLPLLVPLPTPGQAPAGDDELCAGCHEEVVQAFGATMHGRLREHEVHNQGWGCASCHGDGTAHAEAGGDAGLIAGLGPATSPEKIWEVCTGCHRSDSLHYWPGSAHQLNGVSCTDCHNPHRLITSTEKEIEICLPCHTEIQAQMNYPSRHPVREGYMSCSSCHTPHGSSIGLVKSQENVAELCLSCHTQYQGPFIFEHEPVFEGCDTCHVPHGSVANNLLVQNEPFLCLQCHEFHFHAGLEGNNEYEKELNRYKPENNPSDGITYEGGLVPNPFQESGYKRAFTTKCTQCHTQVHGSDLPSQTVSGQGRALQR
jgi:DmsE family decaheme c-type cytochrome